ncbi:MAG: hypothetical protein IT518_04345 [Burkholderiales bacterium]|nr:hypothetical protein [Burkholderiales bacterium]
MPNEPAPQAPTTDRLPVAVFTARDAFELSLREAKVYSSSTLVPKDYQDNVANAMIALNMAKRIGADPLMTMQNLYIVHGRPAWSGQFLIAAFNQCGRFSAMRFETRGDVNDAKDGTAGMRAYATEKATKERIVGPWVTWAMVKGEGWDAKNGSKWKTIPELMFHYRAGAFMVRTHAPDIAMGLQTSEELQDSIGPVDVTQTGSAEVVSAVERVKQQLHEKATGETVDKETGAITSDRPALALDGNAPPALSYAEVRDRIEKAKDRDTLDMAAGFIDGLPPQFHAELHEIVKQRR